MQATSPQREDNTVELRMNSNHIPKLVYEYIPAGIRNAGQPRRRWRNGHPW